MSSLLEIIKCLDMRLSLFPKHHNHHCKPLERLLMLTYADVCWCMLKYADVCWRVCWRMLTYGHQYHHCKPLCDLHVWNKCMRHNQFRTWCHLVVELSSIPKGSLLLPLPPPRLEPPCSFPAVPAALALALLQAAPPSFTANMSFTSARSCVRVCVCVCVRARSLSHALTCM
jgi:hypothetical protein